jgi:hypothetical protein
MEHSTRLILQIHFHRPRFMKKIYVEYPRFFESKAGEDCVLKLKKSFYGLRQAPGTFFEKLKQGLLERK